MTGRYGKPNMTNMPRDIGVRIFREILSSPRPDRIKMHEESVRIEQKMKADAEKNEKK